MDQAVMQKDDTDMQTMCDQYKELSMPGAPHKMLASRAGSWTTKSKYWADPDKPPMESSGTCERKMIFGGRYLQEEFSGEMMGNPFNGLGFTAYDNHTKKYVSTWFDSMSSGIYIFEGTGSADGKTLTLEGRYDDAIKGPTDMRFVTKIKDDKTEAFEMTMTSKSGKVEKCEMHYTRK